MKIDHLSSFLSPSGLILLIILVSAIAFKSNAQTQEKPFVQMVSSDESNRYFDADLTQLPQFFERACLLDIIFRDSLIVVKNSNISGDYLALLCNNNKVETYKVITHIVDLKAKAQNLSAKLSETEKALMVKKFEKYR
jgi:hypothetical protein